MSTGDNAAHIELPTGPDPVTRRPAIYTDPIRPEHLAPDIIAIINNAIHVHGTAGLPP